MSEKILSLHKKGLSRKTIAQQLGVSEWRVRCAIRESHTRLIKQKEYKQNTGVRLKKVKISKNSGCTKAIILSDCIPIDSEVLTRTGWKAIGSVAVNEHIMASDFNGNLTYKPILAKVQPRMDEVYTFNRGNIKFQFTENHRHIHFNSQKYVEKTTKQILANSNVALKSNGFIKGGTSLDPILSKLIGFCLGDGTRDNPNWKISVKKPRKILYLDQMYDESLMTRNVNDTISGKYTIYRIRADKSRIIDMFINKDKTVNWESFLRLDKIALSNILDGLINSDGVQKIGRPNISFHSTIEDNIKLFQTLCHLLGRNCTWGAQFDNTKSTYPSDKTLYSCTTYINKSGAYYGSFDKQTEEKEVTCISVEGSYFLMRQNNNIIITGNCHLPYHDQGALAVALEYMKAYAPDIIVLNGDIIDFYGCSSYRQDTSRIETLQDELSEGKMFFKHLRDQHPDAEIVFIEGNHEERLKRFLMDKAPALTSLSCLAFDELLGLKEYGIKFLDYGRSINLGDLEVTHGDVVRKGSGMSAKAHMEKFGGSVLIGHVHRLGQVYRTNKWGVHVAAENGHLGRIDFEYVNKPDWQHGFTQVEYFDDGRFFLRQHKIDNGTLIVDGVLYEAE